MLKYYVVYPIAYKIFDLNSFTKKIYRYLGNSLGDILKSREGLGNNYVLTGRKLCSLLKEHCNLNKGDKLLELGTGWIHWYSTFIRIFFDVKTDLFDVWDNRQLKTFKRYFEQLSSRLTKEEQENLVENDIIDKLINVNSFDELYELLNYTYIINKDGSLKGLNDNNYDVIFSCSVFENILKDTLPEYFNLMYRILKPGGYLLHIIDIGDHYHYMDKKNTHLKNYLRISGKIWKIYFENSIHYVNNLQASDWHMLFRKSGFKLIYEEKFYTDIDKIKISKDYLSYNTDDLKCHKMIVVYKK